MSLRPEDICPEEDRLPPMSTEPMSMPLYLASVWRCHDPAEVDRRLAGELEGYVYQRDGHPNADVLAAKCRRLHLAEESAISSSGMSSMALAILSQLAHGDHVIVSRLLYGRSLQLLTSECQRLGVESTVVDPCDLAAVAGACRPNTRMMVVETISNPTLRVADIPGLARVAQPRGIRLLVDNTFASPILCRPLQQGADLVLESLSKMMNGHSDVMLGLLAGKSAVWDRVPLVNSAWGLASSPFDCWLAARGLASLALRMSRAVESAMQLARMLQQHPAVTSVIYPGLPDHPDHALARELFSEGFGSILSFTLADGEEAAKRLLMSDTIPFCPSLGEVNTTISHPRSTSHRSLSPQELGAAGISPGMIRVSLGCEATQSVIERFSRELDS